VREIVMVVTDVYLPRAAEEAPSSLITDAHRLPGFERAARFGSRTALPHGWRRWLAQHLGRDDLGELATAAVAAAALGPRAPAAGPTEWIATPVHLSAGLTRVHLDHRGLLELAPPEQATLAADFQRTFAPTGAELLPLASGDFLLRTPEIAALAAIEPARRAGMEVADALPRAAAAGGFRRLLAEIEMWLHVQPLNEARRRQGAPPVTTLWLWGAEGRIIRAERQSQPAVAAVAFGRDPWLQGAIALLGGVVERLPAEFVPLSATEKAPLGVWALEVGGELRQAGVDTVGQALERLDARFIVPALDALRSGTIERLTLLVNDIALTLTRRSRWRVWRRAQAGLGGYR
jgi:hypothetical protein